MENQKIKILLDTIYEQPDLKDDVFNFINPIIIKAYGYLKQSDSNAGIGIEQKNALNNIIFKDIAKLIDIYISLPITYRNEKPIKNGKTHRQMLISNLELIAHKMSKIEDDIYEHLDREMAVKGRVLEDKYTDYVAFEKEDMLEKMEDSFQWNQVKTKLEFEYNKNIQSSFNSEKIFVKNGKKITNNTIKVSNNIKNKIKYYGKKGGNVISSMLKCFITPLVFIRDNILMITSALMIAFLYISIMFFMISDSDQKSAVKDIYKIAEVAFATKNSKENMSQIILDNYSKQYNIEVIKNDKQIIIRSKLESDTCMYLIENLDRTSIDKAYINNNEFSIELEKALLKNSKEQTRSDLDNIRKSICNNPSKNTIDFIINK